MYPKMIDNYGANVNGTVATITSHKSPDECCDLCSNTQGCVAFVWTNETHATSMCYLKSEVKEPQQSDECHVYGKMHTPSPHNGVNLPMVFGGGLAVIILILLIVVLVSMRAARLKEQQEAEEYFTHPLREAREDYEAGLTTVAPVPPGGQMAAPPIGTAAMIAGIWQASRADSPPAPDEACCACGHAACGGCALGAAAAGKAGATVSASAAIATSSAAHGLSRVNSSQAAMKSSDLVAKATSSSRRGARPDRLPGAAKGSSQQQRLRDVQDMLNSADLEELVGLAIKVGSKPAEVTRRLPDGRFLATFDGGGETVLDKVEAIHVVAWLDGQT